MEEITPPRFNIILSIKEILTKWNLNLRENLHNLSINFWGNSFPRLCISFDRGINSHIHGRRIIPSLIPSPERKYFFECRRFKSTVFHSYSSFTSFCIISSFPFLHLIFLCSTIACLSIAKKVESLHEVWLFSVCSSTRRINLLTQFIWMPWLLIILLKVVHNSFVVIYFCLEVVHTVFTSLEYVIFYFYTGAPVGTFRPWYSIVSVYFILFINWYGHL